MARACAFCGTEREVTIEHAWPEWIVERWGRGDYRHIHSTEEGVLREYAARTLEVRVKRACKVCNEGWMSDLEDDTKRLLVWLMELRSLHMSAEDQAQVALWATKTAMMLGFTHPQRRNIPDSGYHYVYKHRQPPPFNYVWLASYTGSPDEPMYRHHGLKLTSDSGRSGNAYGATMCIERLVLRVFGHDLGEELRVVPRDPQMDRLIRPGSVRCTWPPSRAMDAVGLRAYADAFLSPSEGG